MNPQPEDVADERPWRAEELLAEVKRHKKIAPMLGADIDNFASEDIDNSKYFGTRLSRSFNSDQCHFAFDSLFDAQVADFNDIDQLVQLFFDLLDQRRVGLGGYRDP